ncbi:MAG: C39 family peptidase [Bryobacterales bacterium]|nr:C39 family peptidase [Bryobacterales bacterium]
MFTRSQFLLALAGTGAVRAQSPWLDVPFVQQTRAGCGAAAVAMVVGYWARQSPQLAGAAQDAEHIDDLLPASARGIRGQELQRYLEQRGFAVYLFDGEMSDLRQHFERGRPVIVCLGLRGPKRPLHYAVVVGVEETAVWLNDSARGKLFREDLPRFEKAWGATGGWAMLAVPRVAPAP